MRSYLLTLNVFLILIVSSCKKGTPIITLPIDSSKYVSISSISDSSSMLGEVITIYGKNFSKDSIQSIAIGGIQSSIYEINTDSIKLAFKNPANGTIAINTGKRTLTTSKSFRTLSADIATKFSEIYPINTFSIDVNDNLHALLRMSPYSQFYESMAVNYVENVRYSFWQTLTWYYNGMVFRNGFTTKGILASRSSLLLYEYGSANITGIFNMPMAESSQSTSYLSITDPLKNLLNLYGTDTLLSAMRIGPNEDLIYFLHNKGLYLYSKKDQNSASLFSAENFKTTAKKTDQLYLKSFDFDSLSNIYVAGKNEIWQVDKDKKLSIYIGNNTDVTMAQLTNIGYVVTDPEGNLFVSNADATTKDYSVWYINKYKDYVKIAGGTNTVDITKTTSPDGDAKTAAFSGITGLVRDSKGNLFISQSYGGIKQITFK